MMKLALKILLFFGVLFAAIYAGSPLWLPYILAQQLPPGWQLDAIEADYPGPSGMYVDTLSVSGELHAADIRATATALRLSYRGLKTDIDSLSLDVYMRDRPDDSDSMEERPLPVMNLAGRMPQLSVGKTRLTLHHETDPGSGVIGSIPPLVLKLQTLKLLPQPDNSFQLATTVSFEDFPGAVGRIELDSGTDFLKAQIQASSSIESPPWLAVLLGQKTRDAETATRMDAVFDADRADRVWLDSLLMRGSGGWLKHAGGKLALQADFASQNPPNQNLQKIEMLSLSSEKLQLVTDEGTLNLKAQLQASRDGEKIIVELPSTAEIHYRDEMGRVDQLFKSAMPALQRAPRSETNIFSKLDSGSRFIIKPGNQPSVSFEGKIDFNLDSNDEVFKLHTDRIQLNMAAYPELQSMTADGLLKISVEEHTAVTYLSEALELGADSLVVSAEMKVHGRGLISTGAATLTGSRMADPVTSAAVTEMTWRELDLQKMTGNLGTTTQGFSTELDGETWTGFDFDVNFDLRGEAEVRGSGKVNFKKGLQLPVEYSGNTRTNRWDIRFPSATVKLTRLADLLKTLHVELPESTRFNDGYIDLQGVVKVDDEITAKMTINGYEAGASLLESSASDASFSFNTVYGQTVSLSGPVSIETIALAGGIDVKHIGLDLAFDSTGTIDVKNLHAEVFEGRLSLAGLRFANQRLEDTTLELNQVNLASLLAFAGIDGLDGSGILDISLPAGSDQVGLYIQGGTFQSSGPGRLSYTNQGMAFGNIGLQALENFQYKNLSGMIDYDSGGNYQIRVRLEGSNPNLYDGYPIVFNLNIGGLLPELFESLFVTGNFEEAILKEIRKQ